MVARIFRPSRSAMQSGKAKTHQWVLEFEASDPKRVEPLMGYTSSGDMRQQVRLTFDTLGAQLVRAEVVKAKAPVPCARIWTTWRRPFGWAGGRGCAMSCCPSLPLISRRPRGRVCL